jgi:8-oxo-dGTP pyrophosphatase MutT (NUDIX family)
MELVEKKVIFSAPPFRVEALTLHFDGKPASHPYYRLECADWVNVLPITADGKAVLIRQPRPGPMRRTLEIPGGVVDPGEHRDTTMAAARELEEETGYVSQRILSLGSVSPNPAIMTNRIHLFVALGCAPAEARQHHPDPEEDIEIELVPVEELEQLVRTGAIDHALCALCIMLAGKYLPKGRL